MSLLPQRKKSPEEIARLRESFGVPSDADSPEIPTPPAAETLVSHIHQADVVHESAPAALAPMPGPKPTHSLKRSERQPTPPANPEPETPPAAPTTRLEPKPVRSLKKSEQAPVKPRPETDERGKIPYRRHSDEELQEIRRREALATLNTAPPDPKLFPAHPVMIAPGYLLAAAGAACFVFDNYPLAATAACAAAALLHAAAIVLRRPLSRHHAAFISILALFVIVFGALHYFPQLRHAT
jgi:hypothetical protein